MTICLNQAENKRISLPLFKGQGSWLLPLSGFVALVLVLFGFYSYDGITVFRFSSGIPDAILVYEILTLVTFGEYSHNIFY